MMEYLNLFSIDKNKQLLQNSRSCYKTILLTGKADGYLYAQCRAYIYNETGILTRWVGYFQTTVVRFY
jgi:hypothetical protein